MSLEAQHFPVHPRQSLRRYYPDQVQGVSSQPASGAPPGEIILNKIILLSNKLLGNCWSALDFYEIWLCLEIIRSVSVFFMWHCSMSCTRRICLKPAAASEKDTGVHGAFLGPWQTPAFSFQHLEQALKLGRSLQKPGADVNRDGVQRRTRMHRIRNSVDASPVPLRAGPGWARLRGLRHICCATQQYAPPWAYRNRPTTLHQAM